MTTDTLNTVDGVKCNEVMGAMYAFPRIFLPDKAIADAKVSIALLWFAADSHLSTIFVLRPLLTEAYYAD